MYWVGILYLIVQSSIALADIPTLIGGQVAKPGDFPEAVYIRSSGSRCSATIIGPRTIITAAHCVNDNGEIEDVQKETEFVVDQQVFSARCTHHPSYSDKYSYDYALCKTQAIVNVKYATISDKPVEVSELVTLMGFGCTNPRGPDGEGGGNGGNDGKLRYGLAKVSRATSPTGGGQYFYTEDSVAACFGDSGASTMAKIDNPKTDPHLIKGIVSRGNISTRSLLSATYLPDFQNWAKAYADLNRVSICGINRDCSPSEPKPECRRERRRIERYKAQVEKWEKRLEECRETGASTTEQDIIITDEDLEL